MPYPWDNTSYNELLKAYPSRPIRGTDIFEKVGEEITLIGHTLPWCNELENTLKEALETTEKHYNTLVEHGIITPKESTDDLLLKALGAIELLTKKVESLEKGDKHDGYDKSSDKCSGEIVPKRGKDDKGKSNGIEKSDTSI